MRTWSFFGSMLLQHASVLFRVLGGRGGGIEMPPPPLNTLSPSQNIKQASNIPKVITSGCFI